MEDNLSNSFKNTIISEEAINLAKEYSALALDAVITDEMLKHVPILGTLVSFYKIGKSLRERHSLKKIALFLSRLSQLSDDERESFFEEISKKDKYGETLFDKVLLILEKMDETAKAEITGNLARMYAKRVISKDDFLRMAGIVERAVLHDLIVLHNHYRSYNFNTVDYWTYPLTAETKTSLFNLGLLTLTLDSKDAEYRARRFEQKGAITPDVKYNSNRLGEDLANLIFYESENEEQQIVIEKMKARNV